MLSLLSAHQFTVEQEERQKKLASMKNKYQNVNQKEHFDGTGVAEVSSACVLVCLQFPSSFRS